MDRLPVEIVSIIFIFYVEGSKTIESPLRLGAICRTWREIAWSYPHIWTSFSQQITEVYHVSEVRNQLAQDWLSRSGRQPLDISIRVSLYLTDDWMPLPDLLHQLLAILNQHADRWFSIDFEMPGELLAQLNPLSTASDVHSITLRDNTDPDEPSILTSFTHLAPEVVELYDVLFRPSIDWSKVTEFTGIAMPLDHLFRILQVAPNLQKCRFDYVTYPEEEVLSLEHVTHRKMESLCLSFHDPEIEELFMSNISLPALHSLECHCTEHANLLMFLIVRSSCSLKCLTFDGVNYSGEESVDIFRVTASLQSLTIRKFSKYENNLGPFHDALSEHFTSSASPMVLLPALRSFHLSAVDVSDIAWHIVKDFFRPLSQDGTCRPLERVEVRLTIPPKGNRKISPVPYDHAISILQLGVRAIARVACTSPFLAVNQIRAGVLIFCCMAHTCETL